MKIWLRRQRNLLAFTLAALGRRRGKTLALLLVYVLVVFLPASIMLFSHALRQEAGLLLAGSPEILVQRMVAGRHDLIPARAVEAIRALRGVRGVEGRLWGYLFDPVAAANYTVMVSGEPGVGPGKAVIGEGVARLRGAEIGDAFGFRAFDGRTIDFEVGGFVARESALISSDLFLVTEPDFRRLFGVPDGAFTDIAVSVRNSREVAKVAEKIDGLFPEARVVLRDQILRTYEAAFNWREGMILALLVGALAAFLIFAWEKASGLSAQEKREIGVLNAVGWETGDVIRAKTFEGLAVSLSAFFIGYLLAYLHVFYFGAGVFRPVLAGWSILYPEFQLTPFLDEIQVATLLFFTVFPYTLATTVPVWRAATVDPDSVMR